MVSVTLFLELFSVQKSKTLGTNAIYRNLDRNLITSMPRRDDNWWKSWFLFKVNTSSVNGLTDMMHRSGASSLGKIMAFGSYILTLLMLLCFIFYLHRSFFSFTAAQVLPAP